MKKILVLGVVACLAFAAAPASAAWPAGSSFGLIGLDGFVYECIDIRSSGESVKFFWAGKSGGAVLADNHTGDGRQSLTSTLKKADFG